MCVKKKMNRKKVVEVMKGCPRFGQQERAVSIRTEIPSSSEVLTMSDGVTMLPVMR